MLRMFCRENRGGREDIYPQISQIDTIFFMKNKDYFFSKDQHNEAE